MTGNECNDRTLALLTDNDQSLRYTPRYTRRMICASLRSLRNKHQRLQLLPI